MPVLESTYPTPRRLYRNGHISTILHGGLGRPPRPPYVRERLTLSDGDFVDLDWVRTDSNRLLVLTHGLEGDSDRPYIRRLANYFAEHGWDVLAWMCRSCSGELNRAPRLYHHGEIDDLGEVIDHALATGGYERLGLVGLSMGGNISLKYLGVHGAEAPPQITHAVTFSSPLDLGASAAVLDRPSNLIYRRRFMRMLLDKMRAKERQYPGLLDFSKLKEVRRWRDFDEYFSAPLSGFASAAAFYEQASALHFIDGIRRPVLVVQALDDPILAPACFPYERANRHEFVHLEPTRYGGHVAFPSRNNWLCRRTEAWLS